MSTENWTSAGRSDRGRVRDGNEDTLLDLPGAGLFAVADGMGGHAAGEVASGLAAEAMEEELADGGDGKGRAGLAPPDRLRAAVREANRRIRSDARDEPSRSGMGTTLTALALSREGRWRIAHVGDSRAYLLREGDLRQVTADHSWVGRQVAQGEMSKEEARRHPMSSVLERALGTSEQVEVDVEEGEARAGDLFLLCSDGLSDMVPDPELRSLLLDGSEDAAGLDLEETADRLIDAANRAGGHDNVTVLLVRVEG